MRTINKGYVTLNGMMGPQHIWSCQVENALFHGNSECRWATCVLRSGELGISKQRWRPEALGNTLESVVLPFLKIHGIN